MNGTCCFFLGHKEIALFVLKPINFHGLMANRWVAFCGPRFDPYGDGEISSSVRSLSEEPQRGRVGGDLAGIEGQQV